MKHGVHFLLFWVDLSMGFAFGSTKNKHGRDTILFSSKTNMLKWRSILKRKWKCYTKSVIKTRKKNMVFELSDMVWVHIRGDVFLRNKIKLWHLDVGSSPPGTVVCSKGWVVRPLKRYVSWVHNVVRQFSSYPMWALEHWENPFLVREDQEGCTFGVPVIVPYR